MKKKGKKKEVYLDYAAATPVDSVVLKKMAPFWRNTFANASSTHAKGKEARAAVTAARKTVAQALAVKPQEIIFTAGATEANNIALYGIIEKNLSSKKTPHILLSSQEHPSARELFSRYEKEGRVLVEEIPLTKEGGVDIEVFKKMLRPQTLLVSTILVDNKTGAVQPIREMGLLIKDFRKKNKLHTPYFHTDASQAPRYLAVRPHVLGIDLLTLDGSKIYGPKGVGALFLKEGTPLETLIKGGGQERGIRSGTINTPLVVGFAEALLLCEKKRVAENKRLLLLREYFLKSLIKKIPNVKETTSPAKSVPGIISLSFPRISAEEVFTKLNARGVYTSLGSACESEDRTLSSFIKTNDMLRVSLGRETKKRDVHYAVEVICEALDRHDIIEKE